MQNEASDDPFIQPNAPVVQVASCHCPSAPDPEWSAAASTTQRESCPQIAASRIRPSTRAMSSECTPSSKKLSRRPTRSTPSAWTRSSRAALLRCPPAPRNGFEVVASQLGQRARSSLPFDVTGSGALHWALKHVVRQCVRKPTPQAAHPLLGSRHLQRIICSERHDAGSGFAAWILSARRHRKARRRARP